MHDRLLDALLSVAKVRLVAALRDDRLGFPNDKDLRIFIPDIHLISEKRRREGNFIYASNYTDLLTTVARKLADLKAQAAANETIAVYQLGDFLDMWREASGADDQLDVAARIKDDHEELVLALLDDNLNAQFLLGNHDFDLYRWPDYTAWNRRYYLPDTSNAPPSVILLHGDIFDWVELLPDKIQDVFVFLFAPRVQPNEHNLGKMRDLVVQSHGSRSYRSYIQNSEPATLGAVQTGEPDTIPGRWNIQTAGSSPAQNLKFLESAYKCCAKANVDYDMDLRVAVIGHTHHARIATRETDAGGLFTLIDCGAWIENCIADGDANPMPNAQVAALCANEARIYQLGPN